MHHLRILNAIAGYTEEMPSELRRDARAAANKYAPRPESSYTMYGVVAVLSVVMTAWIISLFYDISLLSHPVPLCIGFGVTFLGGLALRRLRGRRHRAAFDAEYKDRGG